MGATRPKTKYEMKYIEERNYEAQQDTEVKRGSTEWMMWGEQLEDVT